MRGWPASICRPDAGSGRPAMATRIIGMAALLLLAGTLDASLASAGEKVPPLVNLRDIAPEIRIDMRYAGANNFTGAPVEGYAAGECLLRRPVAEALARVAEDLASLAPPLALLVYDCYRPERAVRAFAAWARRPGGESRSFHPRIDKRDLFRRGYIAARSGHSRGTAVDLTLMRADQSASVPAAGASTAIGSDCTAEKSLRPDDIGVDMGTAFDCFDERSHTHSAGLTGEQARWRRLLESAMTRRGFVNYSREWWHFSYPAADDGRAFDIPITARHPAAR